MVADSFFIQEAETLTRRAADHDIGLGNTGAFLKPLLDVSANNLTAEIGVMRRKRGTVVIYGQNALKTAAKSWIDKSQAHAASTAEQIYQLVCHSGLPSASAPKSRNRDSLLSSRLLFFVSHSQTVNIRPSLFSQFLLCAAVALLFLVILLSPEIAIRRREASSRTLMPVPKTAMNKHHALSRRENYIRGARQISPMKSETIAEAVKHGSDQEFRSGILAVVSCSFHESTPSFYFVQRG